MDVSRFLASHVRPIDSSGIRRVFDLGASLTDPIDLSIGQPDFPVPGPVKDAMVRAIQEDHNGYTVTRGLPALRDRIRAALQEEFDWSPDVLVTSGVSGALLLALMVCVNPGDEVIIGDPYFVSYKHLVRLVHGRPVIVDLYDDFQLHPERFEAALSERTKLLLICSPSNPTGVVHREADVRALCEIARQRNLLIISDEIYRALCYDDPSPSPVRFAPERTLLLRGFAKSHAMTGLRMGYAAGPEGIVGEMAKIQQYTFVCAPHPAQYGALAAMDTDVSPQVQQYRAKRDLVCGLLQGAYDFVRPSGGFYLFPKAPLRFRSASALVEEAIRRKVLVIPGSVFSERDTHFRISYAAPDEKLRAGCEILCALARA